MKTTSWVLLAFIAVVFLLYSLLQVSRAYGTYNERLGGVRVSELGAGRPEVETAVRARRATAGACGAGFAMLFLLITVIPYRQGEVWAWWALLVGTLLVSVLIVLRIPLLRASTADSFGGGTAMGTLTLLLIVGVGLGLGSGRFRRALPGDSA
jgi:hypothetical protein